MFELTFARPADQATLRALVERRRLNHGRIVVYQRVAAFIFVTRLSEHYCLVGPHESRSLRGLVFFLPSFLTGWWSPSGFFHTLYALAHNLLGGIDVTAQISHPDQSPDFALEKSFKRKRFALWVTLSGAAVLTILWLLITSLPSVAAK